MVSVEEHYKKLLAHHYTWTRGGFDSGAREYKRVIEELGPSTGRVAQALDLGAGSGFQTAALAELGFRVVSLDPSEALLQ